MKTEEEMYHHTMVAHLCQDTKIGFDKSYFPPLAFVFLYAFAHAL